MCDKRDLPRPGHLCRLRCARSRVGWTSFGRFAHCCKAIGLFPIWRSTPNSRYVICGRLMQLRQLLEIAKTRRRVNLTHIQICSSLQRSFSPLGVSRA